MRLTKSKNGKKSKLKASNTQFLKELKRGVKGITLLALVVTIIVMLILAGITLNLTIGNNGIFKRAENARDTWEIAQSKEQSEMDKAADFIGIYEEGANTGKTAPIPEGYAKSQITTEDDVAEGLVIYEIPEGATVNWTDKEDENGNNQSTITMGENTTNLQETVNQYVWIPVDDINSMVMCKSNTGDSICNLIYDANANKLTCTTHPKTATELVGRLYITTSTHTTEDDNLIYSYAMDFTKRDQTYNTSSYHEPNTVSSDASNNITIDQLKSDFTAMAKSVAKNGGFYISRYEIGENGESKKGQPILTAANWNGTNYLGANMWYGLYNTIRNIDANKQMVWGCQYDQIIRFIGAEAQVGHSDRNLTTSHALSGQNELDKMKNIYDLEGNQYEWTAEANSTDRRANRGTNYSDPDNGYFYSACGRGRNYPTSAYGDFSSRSTLCL